MTGKNNPDARLILVTGSTGYIGGRLVPRLLSRFFARFLVLAVSVAGSTGTVFIRFTV